MSVVVVGGGLTGLSTAFHLRRAEPGVRVTVLERGRIGAAASGASAAGIRAMGRDPAERALALASLARWPDLGRELDADLHYRRVGGLRLAMDDDTWGAVPAWVADQRADGIPVEVVDAVTARRLAPGIAADARGGVWCPIDGQAGAMPTVLGFAAAARRLGARIEEGVAARAVVAERGRVVAVERADGERHACDVAILAGGAWTPSLITPLRVRPALEARALQMLLTDAAPPAHLPVLSGFERRLSLKQLVDGAYLIGGGWSARITDLARNRWQILEESVQASLEVARALYPPLAGHRVVQRWAGIEAFTADGLPVIGPVPDVEGLVIATGFSGHGFALSPMLGEVLAALALGRDASDKLWTGLRVTRARRTP